MSASLSLDIEYDLITAKRLFRAIGMMGSYGMEGDQGLESQECEAVKEVAWCGEQAVDIAMKKNSDAMKRIRA